MFDQQKKKQVFIIVDPAKNGANANGNGSCTSQSADRFR